jgi:hypothetical protein
MAGWRTLNRLRRLRVVHPLRFCFVRVFAARKILRDKGVSNSLLRLGAGDKLHGLHVSAGDGH